MTSHDRPAGSDAQSVADKPPSPSPIALILAAGLGTRMRSRTPKILHRLCGRPLLAYVIDAAHAATGRRPVVIYSPATEQVREVFGDVADFALQPEPRGTGDAVRHALDSLPAGVDEIVVTNGDKPLLAGVVLERLLARHRREAAVMTITTYRVPPGSPHGRVLIAGDGRPTAIVERKDDDPALRAAAAFDANVGIYAFEPRWLRRALDRLAPSKASGELYLTDLLAIAVADGERVASDDETEDAASLVHVKDRSDLAAAAAEMRARINRRHALAGVTFVDLSTAYVDASVEIAQDVTLEPNVVLRGRTRIGRDTVIGAGSQIFDSVVGERCRVWASVLESAQVEDDVAIGPFSHLRPGASIGRGAELGNFAEVKQSRLGPGSKQHHFSYIGDAEVGAGVNIGAGTITANYDGREKHRTVIGDGAFIGSDTILRAPVNVGDGAYTGAGSVVTRDVPPGMVAVGVPARNRERKVQPDGTQPQPGGEAGEGG